MSTQPDRTLTAEQRLTKEDSFENETFADLDLQGCDLGQKEFYKCTFERCQFQESNWKRSVLEACVFNGCDLTRAQFSQTALRGVRFEGSKLMGIDWTSVSANPELAFEGCVLRYTSFVGLSLRKTPFLRCTAQEANFFDLDLTDSDFTGTDLTGSNFRGCTLTRTNFSDTVGAFIDPARNRLKGTRVPVETAVMLAQTLGMVVSGFNEAVGAERGSRKKTR
ncbi:pentapeptide repeat-containing protein [Archangium violaceum]|uniref:pentapeptide repeat-containing protein n=1 Tax=Archangium violaceum TaxID=83451 RepID=UPI00195020AC|nr:pentapeptide repeat-containing protein [Archangium violaceum]QRN94195.1 pentapeptide repeat-containing protein [Archangium violaceum]